MRSKMELNAVITNEDITKVRFQQLEHIDDKRIQAFEHL